jgi:hypothetical protein
MNKKQLAYFVLAIFLIVFGLIGFISSLAPFSILIPILAIASGLLILVFTPAYSMRLGWIAGGIYLLFTGLRDLIGFSFNGMNTLLAILGIAAGILLLFRLSKVSKHVGVLLFCGWLLLVGITGLIGYSGLDTIIAGFALAAGGMLIKERS